MKFFKKKTMKVEHTARGFEIINFVDKYGAPCTLQQSSLASFGPPGSSAIWFGTDKDRMHIDREQLEELLPHLKRWAKTGKF